jgi:hypothetical protein
MAGRSGGGEKGGKSFWKRQEIMARNNGGK